MTILLNDLQHLLTDASASYGIDLSLERIRGYHKVLGAYTAEQVAKAVAAHITDPKEGRWFPTPAHLISRMSAPPPDKAKQAARQTYQHKRIDLWQRYEAAEADYFDANYDNWLAAMPDDELNAVAPRAIFEGRANATLSGISRGLLYKAFLASGWLEAQLAICEGLGLKASDICRLRDEVANYADCDWFGDNPYRGAKGPDSAPVKTDPELSLLKQSFSNGDDIPF